MKAMKIVSDYEKAFNDLSYNQKKLKKIRREIAECTSLIFSISEKREQLKNLLPKCIHLVDESQEEVNTLQPLYIANKRQALKEEKLLKSISHLEKNINIISEWLRLK